MGPLLAGLILVVQTAAAQTGPVTVVDPPAASDTPASLSLLAAPELPVPDGMSEQDLEQARELTDLYQALETKFGFGEYREALQPASELVELTRSRYGAGNVVTAEQITNLGLVQERVGELLEAERSYSRSVDAIEQSGSAVDRALVRPLLGLARVYHATGRFDDALEAQDRAKSVYRRHDGLYNPGLIEILDAETETLMATGRWEDADRKQLIAFEVREREFGSDSPGILTGLYALAAWEARLYSSLNARKQRRYRCLLERNYAGNRNPPERCWLYGIRDLYRRAVDIIETEYGKEDLRLVKPLTEIAESYWLNGGVWTDETLRHGIDYHYIDRRRRAARLLERAAKILLEHPDATLEQQVAMVKSLADWNVVYAVDMERGWKLYAQAWQMLAEAGGSATADAAFAEPRLLIQQAPAFRERKKGARMPYDPMAQWAEGHVVVRFDISAAGRAEQIEIVEQAPEGWRQQRSAAVMSLLTGRFRPRIVGGEPVAVEDRVQNMTFRYIVSKATSP